MHAVMKCALLALPLTLLVACGGGPSDADVEAALKARIGEMGSGPEVPTITSAKNLGCTAGSVDGTYSCEVDVEMSVPPVGRTKALAHLTMVQSGGKWTYAPGQVLQMQSR